MLRLSCDSSPAWLERVLSDPNTLLLDHAHCEKKAASMAINLIFKYQDEEHMMLQLSAVAREELEHFERVITLMHKRGQRFERLEPSPYAAQLLKARRSAWQGRLVDTLVCCAFVEARSCERMKLLAENLPDPEMARLYRSLLASEARHHQMYLDFAAHYCERQELRERVEFISSHEAQVLSEAPPWVRMHT